MTESCPADSPPRETQWTQTPMTLLDRLPLPYWAVILGILLLGAASMGLETLLKLRLATGWGPQERQELIEAIATLLVVLYIVTHMRLIKQTAVRSLVQLRPAVKITDEAYERFAATMIRADGRIEFGLLLVAAGLVAVLLVSPADGVRRLLYHPPWDVLALVVILVYYLVAFTSLLNLVYTGIRHAAALRVLAQQPLVINVFDPAALLPFGRLSLVQSLAFVGVFLIPLVIIGPPKEAGWLVIGLSTLSLGALFVPLWGVHRQIARARERVLANICGDLLQVQGALLAEPPAEIEQLKALADRTEVLMSFRKHILAGPSWPFRDFGAVLRAIVAAASPLIYLVLSQLVQTYLFPLFIP